MFRFWHITCRIVVPLLMTTWMASFLLLHSQTTSAAAIVAMVIALAILLPLALVGAVMGFSLARGTLRMACPFCSQNGTVVHIPGGLGLECANCGLIYESGFLKLSLARQANEPEATSDAQLENT